MKKAQGLVAIIAAAVIATGCGSAGGGGGDGGKGTTTSATGSGTGGDGTGTGTGGQGTGGGTGAGTPVSPTKLGDLVITELMNNPAVVKDDDGEWFEIHNPTSTPMDLYGLILDDGVSEHTIALNVVVDPGGYAVLGANADPATNGGITVDYLYADLKFQNVQGAIIIMTPSLAVIDGMTYNESSGLDPDGQSRSLDPKYLSATGNDDDTHWCAATSFINGSAGDRATPGKPNDPCP